MFSCLVTYHLIEHTIHSSSIRLGLGLFVLFFSMDAVPPLAPATSEASTERTVSDLSSPPAVTNTLQSAHHFVSIVQSMVFFPLGGCLMDIHFVRICNSDIFCFGKFNQNLKLLISIYILVFI